MNLDAVIKLFLWAVPMFSAITCALIMLLSYKSCTTKREASLRKLLLYYFTALAFTWFSIICYYFLPNLYIHICALFSFSALAVQVIFYHFIYTLTNNNRFKRFSPLHYLIPLLLSGSLFIWSFFIPLDTRISLVENKSIMPGDYRSYSILLDSIRYVRFFFSIVYTGLIFYRLHHYYNNLKKHLQYSNTPPLRWPFFITVLAVILLFNSIVAISFPLSEMPDAVFVPITISALLAQMIIIIHNIIRRNYLFLNTETDNSISSRKRNLQIGQLVMSSNIPSISNNNEQAKPLTKEQFEIYFFSNKPYLNSGLRLADLAILLNTNRTYLSTFINRTYNMGFRQYISFCRLMEVEQLIKISPDDTIANIVHRAGFGCYRSYLRIKKQEKEHA